MLISDTGSSASTNHAPASVRYIRVDVRRIRCHHLRMVQAPRQPPLLTVTTAPHYAPTTTQVLAPVAPRAPAKVTLPASVPVWPLQPDVAPSVQLEDTTEVLLPHLNSASRLSPPSSDSQSSTDVPPAEYAMNASNEEGCLYVMNMWDSKRGTTKERPRHVEQMNERAQWAHERSTYDGAMAPRKGSNWERMENERRDQLAQLFKDFRDKAQARLDPTNPSRPPACRHIPLTSTGGICDTVAHEYKSLINAEAHPAERALQASCHALPKHAAARMSKLKRSAEHDPAILATQAHTDHTASAADDHNLLTLMDA